MKRIPSVFFTILIISLFSLSIAPQVFGYTVNFYCISDVDGGIAAVGNQLTVDISDPGNGQVLFTFSNTGPIDSTITEIYFDDGTLLGISSLIENLGVDFVAEEGKPSNLPGGNNIDPDFETTQFFLAEAVPPPAHTGIDPGESLGIVFDLMPGTTFSEVIAALSLLPDDSDEWLRIGLHVTGIGIDGEESASFVNNPVPIPGSAILLISGLLALPFFRKGRKASP
jgi:hypothetical protein